MFRGQSTVIKLCALALAGVLGLAETSWGVSVTTSTYATQVDTSPTVHTVTAQHPLTTFPGVTSASSSVRSDVDTSATHAAHAQAWASATVTSSGVTKSASGNGWLDATAPTTKAETWSSSASGSQYILIPQPGVPQGQVPFQLQVGIPQAPTTLLTTGFDLNDSNQHLASDLGPPNPLSFSRTAIPAESSTATPTPGLFDLTFSLNVAVTQTTTIPIFNGQVKLAADGTISYSDSVAQALFQQFLQIGQHDASGLLSAQFLDQFVFPQKVDIQTNVPFDLTFIETMQMGNGVTTNHNATGDPLDDFLLVDNSKFGGGGSFTGTFEAQNTIDRTQYELQAVPEPSGLALAGLALAGLAGQAQRRRK
jgi:hypothetical protein